MNARSNSRPPAAAPVGPAATVDSTDLAGIAAWRADPSSTDARLP